MVQMADCWATTIYDTVFQLIIVIGAKFSNYFWTPVGINEKF